ncbi:MAG: acyltransferase family protein [Acidimicrobiales bacterium]
MPEPIGRDQRYMPGLDGLRAIAVGAVVIFHLNFSGLPGGLLGVGVFFTLSGYLITDLLLSEWHSTGGFQLGDFWLRRARRLLPALFLMMAVVSIWVSIGDPAQLPALRGDVFSAAFYVNNWWLIFQHVSYFARFGPTAPLGNLWSLAVEEQFYLVWPWILLVGMWWVKRGIPSQSRDRGMRINRRRRLLAVPTIALAIASALEMALLYHPSFDPSRVYDGTDTRAFGLLFGAALAMVWPSRALRADITQSARRLIDGIGVIGLIGIVFLMWRTTEYSAFLYRGGMVLLSIATMCVIVSASHPASRFGRALGCTPLRYVGLWSYGIYLWHFPIIVLTTPTNTVGIDYPRAALQVGATVGIAALSWKFIETPIRHGAIGRWWKHVRRFGVADAAHNRRFRTAAIASIAALAITAVALIGLLPSAPSGTLSASSTTSTSGNLDKTVPETTTTTTTTPANGAGGSTKTLPPAPLSSCTSAVHIGDSTSDSLVNPAYLDTQQQLPAQYGRVGVSSVNLQISGGRSIVETLPGQLNGQAVAQQIISQGYHGCWVIALGTDDAADVAVGSSVGDAQRIQDMMQIIGNQPVMWVNAITLLPSGPYSESNMQTWNEALVAACPAYPDMRIYNWAATAAPNPSWFISDGIHYSSLGSAYRSADIATALAYAFPKTTPNTPTTTTTTTGAANKSNTKTKGTSTRSTSATPKSATAPPKADCVINSSPSWPAPPP